MKSRPHVLNPKFSTPTSLPLYFYFVYQLLQESKRLEDCGPVSKDTFIFYLIIIILCVSYSLIWFWNIMLNEFEVPSIKTHVA